MTNSSVDGAPVRMEGLRLPDVVSTLSPMNGTKRAAILLEHDAFLARVIEAVAALGEAVTITTTPNKGRPITHFATADGVTVKFDLYDASIGGRWRMQVGGGYDKYWQRLDSVDVAPIASVIVKPIATKRAEIMGRAIVDRLNATLPVAANVRARCNYDGSFGLDVLCPLTEAQVKAMLAAYVACS